MAAASNINARHQYFYVFFRFAFYFWFDCVIIYVFPLFFLILMKGEKNGLQTQIQQ